MQLFNLSFIKREQFLQQLPHHLIVLESLRYGTLSLKSRISWRLLYRFKCFTKTFYVYLFFLVFIKFIFYYIIFPFKSCHHMYLEIKCQKNSMRRWILERIVGVSVNSFLNELYQHTCYFLLVGNLLVFLFVDILLGLKNHFQKKR